MSPLQDQVRWSIKGYKGQPSRCLSSVSQGVLTTSAVYDTCSNRNGRSESVRRKLRVVFILLNINLKPMSRRKGEAVVKERPAKRQKKETEEKKKQEEPVFTRLVDRARYVREHLKYEHELERLKKCVDEWVNEEEDDDWDKDDNIKDWWTSMDLAQLGSKRRAFLRWMHEQGFPMMFNGEYNLIVFLREEVADRWAAEKRTSEDRRVVESDWKEPE
jgi:hypothetical protein